MKERGGLFLNLEIWDHLASNSYLAKDPDIKIGFGLMGVIAPGITIDDDMYLMLGTRSASVSVKATAGGDSKTVNPESAPFTRAMIGWGDGLGFAVSYVSYSGWATNLSRFEFNLGWSF